MESNNDKDFQRRHKIASVLTVLGVILLLLAVGVIVVFGFDLVTTQFADDVELIVVACMVSLGTTLIVVSRILVSNFCNSCTVCVRDSCCYDVESPLEVELLLR